jgi:ABC-type multidrug transport system permease subunit
MLRVLLAKDLRRAWRNPLPWVINLLVPLVMTALIGLVFGGHSDSGALGRIRFAIVDEDQSPLSQFLKNAANGNGGEQHFEPVFLNREEALQQILEKDLSGAVVIPTNFMRDYLLGNEKVALELIKNPAQSVHPAVIEELMGVLVTGLNAIARNFQSEFPAWHEALDGGDYHQIAALIERAGDKLKTVEKFVNPPLVSYSREGASSFSFTRDAGTNSTADAGGAKPAKKSGNNGSDIFKFLLIGMSAMFLLFLAHTAVSDLHRELRQRTFERYQTMHSQLWPFLAGKVVYAVVTLLFCALVMLGGGGLVFRISWQQPLAMVALTFGYANVVAALFSVLVALVPDERRAGALNNLVGMAMGIVGGCMFPARQLPGFLREHVTPLLPSAWFVESARTLQFGGNESAWGWMTLRMLCVGAALLGVAAFLFRRRFKTGLRA